MHKDGKILTTFRRRCLLWALDVKVSLDMDVVSTSVVVDVESDAFLTMTRLPIDILSFIELMKLT